MKEEQDHFIKNIKIKNFKCFQNFSAEGFGRVNLIGGKNNVGKTAFMEACWINVSSTDIKSLNYHLVNIKYMRENLNLLAQKPDNFTKSFMELQNGISVKSNINNIEYSIKDKDDGTVLYTFKIKDDYNEVNINDFSFLQNCMSNSLFIDSFGLSNNEIIAYYSAIQNKDEELYLNRILSILDSRIEVFKIMNDVPKCKVNGKYLEITEFGDGVRHLISIVTSLYTCENGYLFIDEIDNGIHYTMLDKLWKVVLEVSEKLNVQVFATTHSKEGIESFNRVQQELQDKDTYYFEMYRNLKQNNIEMRALDSNQLEYELTHQGRYRGE
jgi:AAA15 family ATPase/GTPase